MKKAHRAIVKFGISVIVVSVLLGSHYSQQTAGELYEKALYYDEKCHPSKKGCQQI
jgi:hypothetical protein